MALTDKIGIIQEPFNQEVTVKYAYDALCLLKEIAGDFVYRKVLEDISRKHLSRIPSSILENKLNSKVGYISGLLYLAICENTREALSMKAENFYYVLGKDSIINQNPWALAVSRLVPFKIILKEIAEGTSNFTTLIDLTLEGVKKEGGVGIAVIRRKTKQDYIKTLQRYFNSKEIKYILSNDCTLTKGVLLTIPDMFKGYKTIELIETQCEVNLDFCRYELKYKLPESAKDKIVYHLKNNPIFKYLKTKKEVEHLKRTYDLRRRELKKVSSNLTVLIEQLAEATEELHKYLKMEDVDEEYRTQSERIIRESRELIKERLDRKELKFFDYDIHKVSFIKYQKTLHHITLLQYFIGISSQNIELYNNHLIKFVEKLRVLKHTIFNILAEAHLRGRLNEIVSYLISTIEKKDEYTLGHSERVKNMAVTISQIIGLSDMEIKQISFESLLHDIGKIATPSKILKKPSKLTRFEIEIIREHALDTYNIVSKIEIEQSEMIALNAAGHHLRIDGKGYPLELGAIPTHHARIISIADAIDAMNSKRVYRDKRDVNYIIKELEENSGKQFDADIANVVVKNLSKILKS